MARLTHSASLLAATVLCGALAPGLSAAQTPDKKNVSPVAPPTVTAPVFDTTTRVYPPKDGPQPAKTVVAEVEGHAITLGQVADAIEALPPDQRARPYDQLFAATVDRLSRIQALVIAAQREGANLDPAILRRAQAASDWVIARDYIRSRAMAQVTEAELLARYKTDYEGKPGPVEVHLRLIMVPTEAEARSILSQLSAGADFAKLAQRSSKDATAAKGGDVGYVTRAMVIPEVAGVAFATQAGQLVPTPIATPAGWAVVKVEDIRTQPTPPYSVVRASLVDALVREKGPAITDAAIKTMVTRRFAIDGREIQDLPPLDVDGKQP